MTCCCARHAALAADAQRVLGLARPARCPSCPEHGYGGRQDFGEPQPDRAPEAPNGVLFW